MRSLTVGVCVVLLAGASWAVVITGDINPPLWRGDQGTTYQAWAFGTPDQVGVAPDEIDNPYGTATADILGSFFNNTVWKAVDMGHEGVWVIDDRDQSDMILTIENSDVPNPVKHIRVQIVFSALQDRVPNVYVLPEGDSQPPIAAMDPVEIRQIDQYYQHVTYSLTLPWNPTFEKLHIRPRDCQVYIDEVIVDTQCIPEPMTLSMLGVGALLLLRKRR